MPDYPLLREFDQQRVACAQAAALAVVSILSRRGEAPGIAWSDGLVVAAAERLAGFDEARVTGSNGTTEAEVLALDAGTDVAIVRSARVWGGQLAMARSAPLPGASVAVVGREGGDPVCGWGAVRRVGGPWHSRAGGRIARRIELDVGSPIGDGAAIIDADGALVGMAVNSIRRRVLGIPVETIERIVAEVGTHGRLRRGYLGLSVQLLPPTRRREGNSQHPQLIICDVLPESPAEAAGLSVGDLLLEVDGAPLAGPRSLSAIVHERSPGDTLRMLRSRGGTREEIQLQLGERPAA